MKLRGCRRGSNTEGIRKEELPTDRRLPKVIRRSGLHDYGFSKAEKLLSKKVQESL